MPFAMNKAVFIALLFASAPAAAQQAHPTSEREVLLEAIDLNPALQSALIQLSDAAWNVAGEQGRYPWILEIGAGATRTATPRVDAPVGETYGVELDGQIRKHFGSGTDLSFALDSLWQRTGPANATSFGSLGGLGSLGLGSAPITHAFSPTYALTARVAVVQPLIRGAGPEVNWAGLYLARGQKTQAERVSERIGSTLLRDIVVAYWELWYASAVQAIQTQSRQLAIEARDQAAQRVSTGTLAPADVLPFETRVATREEDVLNARIEVDRQLAALAGRMGAINRGAAPGVPSEDTPPEPEAAAATLEREVLDRSPELGDLVAAVDVARIQRRTAGEANRPRLDADAYLQVEGLGGENASAAVEQFAKFGAVSAHAGLTFESPLDTKKRTADVGRANVAIELALSRLEEKRQQVLSDLRVAVAREEGARTRVELASETTEVAERQLEAERQRFKTGSSTPLQVLQAEDDWRNARLRIARAKVDLLQQAVAIDHLAGRLLERYARLLPHTAKKRDTGMGAAAWPHAKF